MILLNISQFRNNMSKVVERVAEKNEAAVLMVNGNPQVVIITVDEYNKLKGTDEITKEI